MCDDTRFGKASGLFRVGSSEKEADRTVGNINSYAAKEKKTNNIHSEDLCISLCFTLQPRLLQRDFLKFRKVKFQT